MRIRTLKAASAFWVLLSVAGIGGCRSQMSCTEGCGGGCGCCAAPAVDGGVADIAPQDEPSADTNNAGSANAGLSNDPAGTAPNAAQNEGDAAAHDGAVTDVGVGNEAQPT